MGPGLALSADRLTLNFTTITASSDGIYTARISNVAGFVLVNFTVTFEGKINSPETPTYLV